MSTPVRTRWIGRLGVAAAAVTALTLGAAGPAAAYTVPANNYPVGWYTLGTYFESQRCSAEQYDFMSRSQYTAYWNYATCTNRYGDFWALIAYKYR
ncbi:hypothetical protein [Micromonospora sp. NPDC051141]|uniref:hypothetical protein n=1 Tax=Micromonospora sp. NPDC051141 TaxID=3364284 RepID=UPI0037AAEC9D